MVEGVEEGGAGSIAVSHQRVGLLWRYDCAREEKGRLGGRRIILFLRPASRPFAFREKIREKSPAGAVSPLTLHAQGQNAPPRAEKTTSLSTCALHAPFSAGSRPGTPFFGPLRLAGAAAPRGRLDAVANGRDDGRRVHDDDGHGRRHVAHGVIPRRVLARVGLGRAVGADARPVVGRRQQLVADDGRRHFPRESVDVRPR